MTRKRAPLWCDFVSSHDAVGELLTAMAKGIQDARGQAQKLMDRLRLDEMFAQHVGKVMTQFPSVELRAEILKGVSNADAEEFLRSLPHASDFDYFGVEAATPLVTGCKEFALCRVTYPFPMNLDEVVRELTLVEGGWKPASFLDLGAFLQTSKICLPEKKHLFAPAASLCRGRCLYIPYLMDGQLGRFLQGMDAWPDDLILVWR